MKTIDKLSLEEVIKEIKERLTSYKKTKPYVFVSYSKRDCDVVYRKVLEWLRMGYNIYIDMDFENHGSDENWITQMKNKIRDNKCVMATVFKSENYCFSYASLIELLTMRSKPTEAMRRNAMEPKLPIDIIELSNKLVKNGSDFSSDEVEEKYEKTFEKIREKHKENFLKNNVLAKEAFIEGLESLAKKIKENDSSDETEVSYEVVNANYNMGYTNFYPEIAGLFNLWFSSYDLNGNNKSIDDVSGVLSRFRELEVYRSEAEEVVDEECQDKTDTVNLQEEVVETKIEDEETGLKETTEDSNDVKKKPFSITGELNYSLYGEEFSGNQSDLMIMTFGKVLKKHPECIEDAIEKFTCLSDVDYTVENNRKEMPSYFRVCYTGVFDEKQVCIGTAYGMAEKLRLIAKLLVFTGEDKNVLQIEGIELPEIKTKEEGNRNDKKMNDDKAKEVYFIAGDRKEGNQSDMMWDVFEALSQKYADKIECLTQLSSVKQVKDVENANTKKAQPSYFRMCKKFCVNDIEYYIGTAYNKDAKYAQINKMLALCDAPDDFFVMEESVDKNRMSKKEKKYVF